MQQMFSIPYQVFPTFVYRTPSFSIEALSHIYSEQGILKSEIIKDNKLFKEAIYIASPDLYQELESFISNNNEKGNDLKLSLSILRYYIRMCIRCTPFGLFAGCGVGKIGSENTIQLKPHVEFKSHIRLDMSFFSMLVHDIEKSNIIKRQVKYFSNTSVYQLGKNFRYTEYQYLGGRRKYILSSIEATPYLTKVLGLAKNGAYVEDLVTELTDYEISYEEAEEYIFQLIDNQLIVCELSPVVTGEDLLERIINQMGKLYDLDDNLAYKKSSLIKVHNHLKSLNSLSPGRSYSEYEQVVIETKQLTTSKDYRSLFQTDLFIPSFQASLDKDTVNQILEGIQILNKLTIREENPLLQKFRNDFSKRYEAEEIPLLEALDPEIGINFGNLTKQPDDYNFLLQNIGIQENKDTEDEFTSMPLTYVQNFIQQKYEGYISNTTQNEIEITQQDLESFPEYWFDIPDTVYSLIEILDKGKEGFPATAYIKTVSGPSASVILGRFCHLNPYIQQLTNEIIQKEEELCEESILAEILHLPQSITGNIIFKPILRKYEIPCLVNFSTDPEYAIPISDLKISVNNGKIILRSERLNKRIIPRLTNAHNYSKNVIPVYQFLCTLQTQSITNHLFFRWGLLLENKPFLPRVVFRNIILSPAMWLIHPVDMTRIPNISAPDFFEKAWQLKTEKNVPDKVFLVDGDNKLLIDFYHLLSIQLLFAEKSKPIQLQEYLFEDSNSMVKQNGQPFANEVILCFHKK